MTTTPLADTDVRLCPPDQTARTYHVHVPDRPGVEWLVLAIPVDLDQADDPTVSAQQVALDVAQEARDTAHRLLYPRLLERRRDAR